MFYRYQPAVSLRAQLRAEQCSLEDSFSNQIFQQNLGSPTSVESHIQSPTHSRSPPSPRPMEPLPMPSTHRPFIELMSPRLSQRRIVTITTPPQRYISNGPVPTYKFMQGDMPIADLPKIPTPSKTCSSNFRVQQSVNINDFSFNSQKSSNPSNAQNPKVVAAGTTPSVWVPRQTTDSTKQQHQQPADILDARRESIHPRPTENGHTVAFYTNSLPRLDRRNHSVGPHISSHNRLVLHIFIILLFSKMHDFFDFTKFL